MAQNLSRNLLVLTLLFWSCIGAAVLSIDASMVDAGLLPPPPPMIQLVDRNGRLNIKTLPP